MAKGHASVVAAIPGPLAGLADVLSQAHSKAAAGHQGGFGSGRFLLADAFNNRQHGAGQHQKDQQHGQREFSSFLHEFEFLGRQHEDTSSTALDLDTLFQRAPRDVSFRITGRSAYHGQGSR